MISFKQWIKEYKTKFVSLKLTDGSTALLKEYVEKHGFNTDEDFDFHLTIHWTTSIHNAKNQIVKVGRIKLNPLSIELLGKEKNIPVLKIEPTKQIIELRKHFDDQGYVGTWSTFKPHITLTYTWNGTPDINNIPLPTFPIHAEVMTIEDGKST